MKTLSVLLVIDLQRGFITPETSRVAAAVNAAQRDFDVVVAARFTNPPNSPFRRLVGWQEMGPGTAGLDLAFTPRRDAIVIEKTGYTAMQPELLAILRRCGVRDVHIAGLETDACVLKTALDLFESGYRPIIHRDLCGATRPGAHEAALDLLSHLIGKNQIV